MSRSVKIATLTAPQAEPGQAFDPGSYLASLEFYETDEPITESDRDGMAQLVHYLAFFALRSDSPAFDTSEVPAGTSAFQALQGHFGALDGWSEVATSGGNGVSYRRLASFLREHYPPRRR